MTEPIRLVIPWDVSRTSENRTRRGGHWSQRSRVMKQARELARLIWLEAGSPVSPVAVRVSIISRRGRQMDITNIVGGAKPLLDGIFVRGLTPDDGPKWVELGSVRQENGARYRGNEEVEFIVEGVGP